MPFPATTVLDSNGSFKCATEEQRGEDVSIQSPNKENVPMLITMQMLSPPLPRRPSRQLSPRSRARLDGGS
jgi:hypothetical protein